MSLRVVIPWYWLSFLRVTVIERYENATHFLLRNSVSTKELLPSRCSLQKQATNRLPSWKDNRRIILSGTQTIRFINAFVRNNVTATNDLLFKTYSTKPYLVTLGTLQSNGFVSFVLKRRSFVGPTFHYQSNIYHPWTVLKG